MCITGAYVLRMQTALMSPLGFMCGTELRWGVTGVDSAGYIGKALLLTVHILILNLHVALCSALRIQKFQFSWHYFGQLSH